MHTRRTVVAVVALCALFVSVWMLPEVAASEGTREPARPLAEMTLSASQVDWQPTVEYERVVLTVAGPGDLLIRRELDAGQTPSLTLSAWGGDLLPDGMYTYELRFVQGTGKPSGQPLVLSGYLSVQDGSFVTTTPRKAEAAAPSDSRVNLITAEDEVIPDDLIVQGLACIGFECEEGDGGSSIRFKDSVTGITFDDVPDSFSPTHDWALKVNDFFLEGSGEYFSIFDVDTSLKTFTVEGDAPGNALYVRANGNLGLGTSTPAQDIHAMSGNTPALRLEQDTSGSLSARTWDLGASHTELFVKDVTNSSSVPFRIQAGAPSNSVLVSGNGDVGVGTSSPAEKLHVFENVDANTLLTVENPHTGLSALGGVRAKSDTVIVNFQAHGSGRTISRFGQSLGSWTEFLQVTGNGLIIGTLLDKPLILGTNSSNRLHITSSGNIGIGTTSPTHPLQMGSGAHVTAGGVWTNASSRDLKHDIQALGAEEARSALASLEPVRFRYNTDPGDEYLGFIAEDVPDLVATSDHKTLSAMDLVAVLTRMVQEQQEAIGNLQTTVASLSEKLAAMEEQKEKGIEPR